MTTALHPNASALSAFRILPDGNGRAYTIVEAPAGRAAIERTIRMARAVGYLTEDTDPSYAVLDVLNDNDDIVQDYTIPTAHAFKWWYRRLGLRVAS